jgi:hypothetical protein
VYSTYGASHPPFHSPLTFLTLPFYIFALSWVQSTSIRGFQTITGPGLSLGTLTNLFASASQRPTGNGGKAAAGSSGLAFLSSPRPSAQEAAASRSANTFIEATPSPSAPTASGNVVSTLETAPVNGGGGKNPNPVPATNNLAAGGAKASASLNQVPDRTRSDAAGSAWALTVQPKGRVDYAAQVCFVWDKNL